MILMILLLVSSGSVSVFAQDASMQFSFELSIDGSDVKEVEPGDIITVSLHLRRTDKQAPYTMYSFQNEIRYDAEFFELIEDNSNVYSGLVMKDIERVDGFHELYINYLSMSGGAQWDEDILLATIQLKVIADSGVAKLTSEDYFVSHMDGKSTYSCAANEVLAICTTECTVRFMTNGGSKIENQIVPYGEKISRPEDPVREGMQFVGWYADINLTEPWNFDTDVVETNMSLYAKWEPAENVPKEQVPVTTIYNVGIILLLLMTLLLIIHGVQKISSHKGKG